MLHARSVPGNGTSVKRLLAPLFSLALALLAVSSTIAAENSQSESAQDAPIQALEAVADGFLAISIEEHAEAEYQSALTEYKNLLDSLERIDYGALPLDEQVDHALLSGSLKTRIFEIETVALHTLHPVSYFRLGQTNRLFIRPGAISDAGVEKAVAELKRLPAILKNAQLNLRRPARIWTENAHYTAYYAHLLLRDYVPEASVDDPDLKAQLLAAAKTADAAVSEYERWLRDVLLPRSDRSPAWDPAWIEYLQFTKEELTDWPLPRMLAFAEQDMQTTRAAMQVLARRIHPSGDLRRVWDLMLEEAPAWEEVLPMAQRFVDIASSWLQNEGDHVVSIPDYIDYGARISPPMARRILSFGGATRGPDVAGRQSGYYIITPLEARLSEEEAASRLRSYNPYWTHVISYHEWLGHNVQIAAAREHVERPVRRSLSTGYFSQAWSFYLEKLLEDEGYFEDRFAHVAALKHRMARLQMRQWRNVRVVTKLRMAMGQMSFAEAVQAYQDEIGMEPTNAFIEVQRDSQTPHPPGREIIGEQEVLALRAEYQRRMGDHYQLRNFNDTLLTYGDLPFRQIRRLMFRD